MKNSHKWRIILARVLGWLRRVFGREAYPCGGAWLRVEGRTAIICASCHSKKWDEARAMAAGYNLSHGICEHCLRRDYPEYAEQALALAAAESARASLFFGTDHRESSLGAGRLEIQG